MLFFHDSPCRFRATSTRNAENRKMALIKRMVRYKKRGIQPIEYNMSNSEAFPGVGRKIAKA